MVDSYLAATICDFLRQELLASGRDFTFETVMSHGSKVDFMREAQRRGYRTYLYFIATGDADINIDRVDQRVALGGHPVDPATVRQRYERSIALLLQACEAANRAYVFDNSGQAHQMLAEVTDGDELTLHSDTLPAWFTGSALWQAFQA
ncbi:hypothetical protein GT347_26960 [Xylophilus rhododendri]|uniref:Zeta toxin domain-containing protein n=1 Tax=Xylophilus rhododendri TaxID=2697032 RepID=A0A857JCB9_9BURK|nr:zeta toxin family protein [Xylophilus rhododendri]QHJ01308.1 hypothetical protein GT347_26960 [Xylophilus rhododendri]